MFFENEFVCPYCGAKKCFMSTEELILVKDLQYLRLNIDLQKIGE